MRSVVLALAALLSVISGAAAAESAFPSKVVRLIAPFAVGGSADLYARLLAVELGKAWKQTVIVENKAGAGGILGQQALLAAPADGHTMILVSGSFAINPLLNPKLPYADKDFVPVVKVASTANALIVPADSKYRTLKDLLDDARAHPGTLSYGYAGNGTSPHIAGETFKHLTKLDIVPVPYKGNAPVVSDVVAGQIPMGFASVVDIATFVRGGKMRALALASRTRSPQLPDVPTFEESGVRNFDSAVWFGLVMAAGTPSAIVEQVNRDVNAILKRPDMRARIEETGSVAEGGTQAEFIQFVESEKRRISPVVKAANIRAD